MNKIISVEEDSEFKTYWREICGWETEPVSRRNCAN